MAGRARAVAIALAAVLAAGLAAPLPLAAQQGGAIPLAGGADGAPISGVEITLVRGSGNTARDQAAVARLRRHLAGLEGRSFSRLLVETRLAAPRDRLGLGSIGYRVLDGVSPGSVRLAVDVDTADPGPNGSGVPSGLLAGDAAAFPTLYRSDRSYLTAIVGGGFGVYSDLSPWFGQAPNFLRRSPIAGRLPGRHPAWTEGYTEIGLGGAAQLGTSPIWLYGAATALTSWSFGQDVFRADTRVLTRPEKAYAGVLWIDPATGASLNVSAGRQNITLNDGFLIHFVRGSANAGVRGASYLGPRNANDISVMADVNAGPWTLKGFVIDPDELPVVDGRSVFAGANLRYALAPDLAIDASFITVPRSDATLLLPGNMRQPRQGLRTYAGHLRWTKAFGVEGLWVAGEFARQTHERFSMAAWAGYALIGYQAAWLPWSPSLSYRYSHATGDNPRTARYERFDPLLSTGLGNWLQGITFGKLASNSNLAVHRLQFNVQPNPRLNLTLDWHLLRAPERNNLGANPAIAQLASRNLGQEFTATARWAINRQLYLQAIASVAVPGAALRAVGAKTPWSTFQASLYWSL